MSNQNNNGINFMRDSPDISTLTHVVIDNHNIQISDVASLQSTLSNKADSSTLNSNVASLTASIRSNLTTTNAALAAKADTSTLNSSVSTINSAVATKADTATLTSNVATISSALSSKANSNDVNAALSTTHSKLILQTAGAGISTLVVIDNIRYMVPSDSLLQVSL